MKGLVAFGFFLLFLAGLALINLGNRTSPADAQREITPLELAGARWQLVAMRGVPAVPSAIIEVQFTRGGALNGRGPCQHFAASYTHAAGQLKVSEPQTGPSTCPADSTPLEPRLLRMLTETASLGFDGRNLVLLAADQTRLARFVAEQPLP